MSPFQLVPWSNRIGAGEFEFDGVHYTEAPNRVGEVNPIQSTATNGGINRR